MPTSIASTQELKGFLIDLDGVLYIGERLIPGAPHAIRWLRERSYPIRFLTNTTMKSAEQLVGKLSRLGIPAEPEEMFNTTIVAARFLASEGISRVQLVVAPEARSDFTGFEITTDRPQAVVVGDMGRALTFDLLNDAFVSIREGARFIALQKNRFWRTEKGLALDAGAFVAALEYATETQATLVGKPNPLYFETALKDLGLPPRSVAMVGDDLRTDIAGAHGVGARTILVRTGKDPAETSFGVRPDWRIDSIAELPRLLEGKTR